VGIILSANRWIRLASNHLAEYCFRRYPSNLWLVGAFITGSFVTAVYGLADMFVMLLGARILWGVCFSFLRQAGVMTVVKSSSATHLGERMGFFRGVIAIWLTIGLFLGSLSHDMFGFTITLVCLSILSLVAVPLGALSQKSISQSDQEFAKSAPGNVNAGVICCGFASGLVGAGMIMSTLGLILKQQVGESMEVVGYTVGVATLTGIMLGFRWLIDGLGSPVLGAVADRFGRQRSITHLLILNAVTLLVVSFLTKPALLILLIFVFFSGATALMTLLSAQAGQSGPRSVASYSTAVDLGMSMGPIIGWSIAQFGLPTNFVFLSGGVIYLIASLIALKTFGLN
jgi:MFS family permease